MFSDNTYLNTLKRYFSGYDVPNPFILNLACGTCSEGYELLEYFNNPRIVGIDIDEVEIEDARKINHSDNFEFYTSCVTNASRYLHTTPDIIIIKNPCFTRDASLEDALQECERISHPGSILFITSNFSLTHNEAINRLMDSSYKIQTNENNPDSTFTPDRDGWYMSLDNGFVIKAERQYNSSLDKIVQTA